MGLSQWRTFFRHNLQTNMSGGRGKGGGKGYGSGGKGLGKGGAKRHKKVFRDNIQGITKPVCLFHCFAFVQLIACPHHLHPIRLFAAWLAVVV